MTRQIPIQEWTCGSHDYPEQCECCERWDCEECAKSEWRTTGHRDATVWEEMLYDVAPSIQFSKPLIIHELTRSQAAPDTKPREPNV